MSISSLYQPNNILPNGRFTTTVTNVIGTTTVNNSDVEYLKVNNSVILSANFNITSTPGSSFGKKIVFNFTLPYDAEDNNTNRMCVSVGTTDTTVSAVAYIIGSYGYLQSNKIYVYIELVDAIVGSGNYNVGVSGIYQSS